MPGILVGRRLVSTHPHVSRGTNAPAHLGTPALVPYSTESTKAKPPWLYGKATAVNTTTRPPARTKGEPASIHASGGKVARDEATSKDPLESSSCRHLATSMVAQPRTRFAVARKAVLFARGSTNNVRQSGRSTENGTPGSPPPAPTSTTTDAAGHNRAKANESGR